MYASGLHYYVKQSQMVSGKQCRQHMRHAVSHTETACTTHMLVEIIHNQMLMSCITSVFAGIHRPDVLHSCTTSMAPYIYIYIRRSFGTLFHAKCGLLVAKEVKSLLAEIICINRNRLCLGLVECRCNGHDTQMIRNVNEWFAFLSCEQRLSIDLWSPQTCLWFWNEDRNNLSKIPWDTWSMPNVVTEWINNYKWNHVHLLYERACLVPTDSH